MARERAGKVLGNEEADGTGWSSHCEDWLYPGGWAVNELRTQLGS